MSHLSRHFGRAPSSNSPSEGESDASDISHMEDIPQESEEEMEDWSEHGETDNESSEEGNTYTPCLPGGLMVNLSSDRHEAGFSPDFLLPEALRQVFQNIGPILVVSLLLEKAHRNR